MPEWRSPEFADELKVAVGRLLVSVIKNHIKGADPLDDESGASLRKTLEIEWTFRLFHSSLQISCNEIAGHILQGPQTQRMNWNDPFSEASIESLDNFHGALRSLLERKHNEFLTRAAKRESSNPAQKGSREHSGASSCTPHLRSRGAVSRSFMDIMKDSEWSGLNFEDESDNVMGHNSICLFAEVPDEPLALHRMFHGSVGTSRDDGRRQGTDLLELVATTKKLFQKSIEKLKLRSIWFNTSNSVVFNQEIEPASDNSAIFCFSCAEKIAESFGALIIPLVNMTRAQHYIAYDALQEANYFDKLSAAGTAVRRRRSPARSLWTGLLQTSASERNRNMGSVQLTRKANDPSLSPEARGRPDVEIVSLGDGETARKRWTEGYIPGKLSESEEIAFVTREVDVLDDPGSKNRRSSRIKKKKKRILSNILLQDAPKGKHSARKTGPFKNVLRIEAYVPHLEALKCATSRDCTLIARVPKLSQSHAFTLTMKHLASNNLCAFGSIRDSFNKALRMVILKPLTPREALVYEVPKVSDRLQSYALKCMGMTGNGGQRAGRESNPSLENVSSAVKPVLVKLNYPRRLKMQSASATCRTLHFDSERIGQKVTSIDGTLNTLVEVATHVNPSSLFSGPTEKALVERSKEALATLSAPSVAMETKERSTSVTPTTASPVHTTDSLGGELERTIGDAAPGTSLNQNDVYEMVYNETLALDKAVHGLSLFVEKIRQSAAAPGDKNALSFRKYVQENLFLEGAVLKKKHPPAPSGSNSTSLKIKEYQMQIVLRLEVAALTPSKLKAGLCKDPISKRKNRDICNLLQSISFIMDAVNPGGLSRFLNDILVATYKDVLPKTLKEIYDELMMEAPARLGKHGEKPSETPGAQKSGDVAPKTEPGNVKDKAVIRRAKKETKPFEMVAIATVPEQTGLQTSHGPNASAHSKRKKTNGNVRPQFQSLSAVVRRDRAGGLVTEKKMKLNNFTRSLTNTSFLFRTAPNPKRKPDSGRKERKMKRARSGRSDTSGNRPYGGAIPVEDQRKNVNRSYHRRQNSNGRDRKHYPPNQNLIEETPAKRKCTNGRELATVDETPERKSSKDLRQSKKSERPGSRALF